jgi:hypothetical protein
LSRKIFILHQWKNAYDTKEYSVMAFEQTKLGIVYVKEQAA